MSLPSSQNEWFSDWFHSPYYKLLYSNRNEEEAEAFVEQIYTHLNMQQSEYVMDVPCGWGRHSTALHDKGLIVTGLDINPQLIARASQHTEKGLHFAVHDMRKPYAEAKFDYVLNLFTSMGYFTREEDNKAAVKAFALALRPKGRLLIDFLNIDQVRTKWVPEEEQQIDHTHFYLKREIKEPYIYKHIRIEDQGKILHFTERVMLLSIAHFKKYFLLSGLRLVEMYGDYNFSAFDTSTSERLLLVAEKI